jgi:hypothetical protein
MESLHLGPELENSQGHKQRRQPAQGSAAAATTYYRDGKRLTASDYGSRAACVNGLAT